VTRAAGTKQARHRVEYLAARAAFGLAGLLSYATSSRVFGALFSALGPRLGANRRILDNLALVRADMPLPERHRLAREVWRHIGYTLADLAHLDDLRRMPARITVDGTEILSRLTASERPVLFFSAHIACWEVIRIAARQHNIAMSLVYRRFNNPLIDDLAQRVLASPDAELLAKGMAGARRLVQLMGAGKPALLLADQRLANGIELGFLGAPAMTAPALAEISLKHDVELVPVQVIRERPGHFRVVFGRALSRPAGGDHAAKIRDIMTRVNLEIGRWVEQNPAQWFWLHRRWKISQNTE